MDRTGTPSLASPSLISCIACFYSLICSNSSLDDSEECTAGYNFVNDGIPFDIVVAADVIYEEEILLPLVLLLSLTFYKVWLDSDEVPPGHNSP